MASVRMSNLPNSSRERPRWSSGLFMTSATMTAAMIVVQQFGCLPLSSGSWARQSRAVWSRRRKTNSFHYTISATAPAELSMSSPPRFPAKFPEFEGDLRIIANDISAAGLRRASISLVEEHHFEVLRPLVFDRAAIAGYNAGSVMRRGNGGSVTVVFMHGNEHEDPKAVRCLVEEINEGRPVSITTSWYSGIAHIPTAARRADFFAMLADLTDARGEMLIAPSVSGDLVKLQALWAERLRLGDVPATRSRGLATSSTRPSWARRASITSSERTLRSCCGANTAPHQRAWLEAIRLPDPEFVSRPASKTTTAGCRRSIGSSAGGRGARKTSARSIRRSRSGADAETGQSPRRRAAERERNLGQQSECDDRGRQQLALMNLHPVETLEVPQAGATPEKFGVQRQRCARPRAEAVEPRLSQTMPAPGRRGSARGQEFRSRRGIGAPFWCRPMPSR